MSRAAVRENPTDMRYASFRNRAEAGALLATRLQTLVTPPAVVAGIPRGGLAVALPIAEALRAPLTLALARKLTVPVAPELALGAVDEDGELLTDAGLIASVGASSADIERARERACVEIGREREHYGAPPLARLLPGTTAVLVDDGLATGLTMRVAVAYAKRHGARCTVVASPCASRAAMRRLEREADRVVTLLTSGGPFAVGAFYEDFRPVPDEDVLALLERASATTRARAAPVGTAPDAPGLPGAGSPETGAPGSPADEILPS